jgi:hypothetical protein
MGYVPAGFNKRSSFCVARFFKGLLTIAVQYTGVFVSSGGITVSFYKVRRPPAGIVAAVFLQHCKKADAEGGNQYCNSA